MPVIEGEDDFTCMEPRSLVEVKGLGLRLRLQWSIVAHSASVGSPLVEFN